MCEPARILDVGVAFVRARSPSDIFFSFSNRVSEVVFVRSATAGIVIRRVRMESGTRARIHLSEAFILVRRSPFADTDRLDGVCGHCSDRLGSEQVSFTVQPFSLKRFCCVPCDTSNLQNEFL